MSNEPFAFDDPADYARVREVFRSAGYTDEGIVGLLRSEGLTAVGAKRLPPLLRRTNGGTPLATLVRLFILGVPVDVEAARAALAPMSPAEWLALGLLEAHDDGVRATVQVRCYEDLLVAWDFSLALRGVLRPDYVMGISPSTLTLAGLTIRGPVRAALDVGTGSGFHAFLAARHSERVVAVDKNPRSVQMAHFNARLNGLDSVDVREGDLFAPVAGERFDLIVSNPPFIISPDNSYFFLHSGMKGDEVCERIAREAPPLLEEGGYCQFLANWAVLDGEAWDARLGRWFEGSGCDAWVLRRATQAPDEYAAVWIETGEVDERQFAGFFDSWMAYYERERIVGIGSGLISMRKSSAHANWFHASDGPELMGFPSGGDIERAFDALDMLRTHDDEMLLEARLRVAPEVRLQRVFEPGDGGWSTASTTLKRAAGLQYEGLIDDHGALLVTRCDGQRSVRAVLDELADEVGADPATVAPAALAIVRQLVEQGFLLPAGAQSH